MFTDQFLRFTNNLQDLLLARSQLLKIFPTPTNNHLRTSSNTRNQAIIQGDRVNIQSRNSGNAERNNRRAYVQEENREWDRNAPNEIRNGSEGPLRTSSYIEILQTVSNATSCRGKTGMKLE
ncbi:hypothetical protein Tco_0538175 [Tanacetum coccineum]